MDYLEFGGQEWSQPMQADMLCSNNTKQSQLLQGNLQVMKNGCEINDNQSWTTDTSIPSQDIDYPSISYQNNKLSPIHSPQYSQNSTHLFKANSLENSVENSYFKDSISSPSFQPSYLSMSQSYHQSAGQQKQIPSSSFRKQQPQSQDQSIQLANPFSRKLQSSSLAHQIEGIESKQAKKTDYITDRYIPSRKQSKLNTYQAYECNENYNYYENQFTTDSPRGSSTNSVFVKNAVDKEEINQISISQLYKNYVLGIKDKRMLNLSLSSAHAFCPYKNQNVLRFTKPNILKNSMQIGIEANQQKSILQSSSAYPNQLFLNLEEEQCCSHLRFSRKISKVPFKVLDAPALQDDFYLNLIDWSSQNILAVGLSSCVYLWSACSSRVTKLCDFGRTNEVTSVNWSPRSSLISIGTNTGEVEIWDSVKLEKVRVMKGHSQRVGTLAWNTNILTSGSRDKTILQRDLRTKNLYEQKLIGHKQEVCGLKWSFDEQQLASGGNDNKLFVWNMHSNKPITKFGNHNAAVKALAWSPHQHGLLVSGGGTQDRTIRFWNTLTSRQLECIETGSQVCNLIFSKNVNELVSTHGYSQNQIIIWSYPEMEKLITLTGHSCRVLYLAMSPDGQTIVTGAGDETLRFWNVFPSNKEKQIDDSTSTLLSKNHALR
ncbi:anaphase-promoting complex protein (macronuclear) [Tetrahymena thermophila SB210]|uniref:Anaphase-promoting complex protein n=1 Tax=Tetrahymena thermophila (strain SB210) TaxID=312017 RepID=Q22XT4_TETTS|nr:anaphase-promoting complex protein [Tetrahymena thermophila SB210]EAR90087.1 anaphase-promoting complex protein [Tetrahymena thermophila SB210]|eukprot:XP_001010332.1 anaphase-promoting complex protein [Tetrahymena thermophila SB210]